MGLRNSLGPKLMPLRNRKSVYYGLLIVILPHLILVLLWCLLRGPQSATDKIFEVWDVHFK